MKRQFPVSLDGFEPGTRAWLKETVKAYELEPHHVKLLVLAAQSWDLSQRANAVLVEKGFTYDHPKTGRPVARPEVAIARDNNILYARLLRELDLDIEQPPASAKSPPQLRSVRGR
jgi:hypothetical protein